MIRLSAAFLPLLLIAILLAPAVRSAAAADGENSLQIELLDVGFQNRYKVGQWTPIRILVSAEKAPAGALQVVLVTTDGDGVSAHYAAQAGPELTIRPGESVELLRYVKFGRMQSGLTVQLLQEGEVIAARNFASSQLPTKLPATSELVVTVGSGAGVDDALRLRRRGERELAYAVLLESAAGLPDRWYGYDSIDTLVLTTRRSDLLTELDAARLSALVRWVRLGGTLVVSVGGRGAELLAGEQGLAQLVPGDFQRVIALRETAGLETFSEATERLDTLDANFSLDVTALENVEGQTLVTEVPRGESAIPLAVTAPFGLGRVTFAAFDLDAPVLTDWQGRPRLMANLLQPASGRRQAVAANERGRQVTHIGYEDLSGQLRSALDQFDQVVLVPFSLVAALIVVYILLIGPADYFLIRKLGRLQWAWVTFPVTVIAFSALAWILTNSSKGDRLRINQVDVVDIDIASSSVRGTTWATLYSPRTQSFNLTVEVTQEPSDQQESGNILSWQGLPGKGLGGLNTNANAAFFRRGYWIYTDYTAGPPLQGAVVEMPVQVASTKSLTATWWDRREYELPRGLDVDSNGLLSGFVYNPLSVELADCMLFYGHWAYALEGTLLPNDLVRVDDLRKRILDWHLTRRRLVDATNTQVIPNLPWDPASFDVPRILEIMMFHKAAGGEAYTQLTHRYQDLIDLSDQLEQGRAVLWGRAEAPAARLARDGELLEDAYDRHWTYYRFVLPVENQVSGRRET